ncbi:hypothetical protein [Thalassotalea sp. PP2-459]|uniref:hypothetical protein n=1 Tax=Thalassotalea sp. PP2-459 TaxID=1742724 RepID=UPI000942244C|nr:hypothetical protein [Thalassotalea sp. PP2-459]OKY25037.1 hypothetical protein BI291_17390 [Thalassotalea sp. PP2-459]
MSLEQTKAQLLASTESEEKLLEEIDRLYFQEIQSDDKSLQRALSELHNSKDINLISLIGNIDRSSCEQDFFALLHVFEGAIPLLEDNTENILNCLTNLTIQAGRDLAVGGVYRAFQDYCSLSLSRARESILIILNQHKLDPYAPFLSNAILAYPKDNLVEAIQTAEKLIAHENEFVRRQGYFSLSMLDVEEVQASIIWKLFSISANNEEDNDCCASLLRAVLRFGEKFPHYWQEVEGLLTTINNTNSPEAQYTISDILAFQQAEIPENILLLLIQNLTNISPEHKGIVDKVDHVLVKLVEKGQVDSAINILESVISDNVKFSSLDYFSSELLSKHQNLVNHLVTKWFLSGETALCHGILDLIHDSTDKNIEIQADTALLTDEASKLFVCRKAIGWLFMRPIAAASLILSIYDSVSTQSHNDLEHALFSPLFLSYPGELSRYFQSCIESEVQVQLCQNLLDKLQAYNADLGQVAGLKELRAPSENVNAYWKQFNKSMSEAHEEASKSSIVNLFTTQRLLYGNSSIYYVHTGNGERVRQEMQMQSISHSAELPRLNVLDPEVLDYTLRVYRNERFINEVNS